jgi:hypothetical protein
MQLHHRVDSWLVQHGEQLDPQQRRHILLEPGDLRHHQGLGRLGREAGRNQPLGQVGRLVVAVVLPLPRSSQSREAVDLRSDDRVGGGLVQVGLGQTRSPRPTRRR